MGEKSLADSRLIFRLRTEMVDVKDNMRNRYRGTSTNCEACDMRVPESQMHVMTCMGYEEQRDGVNSTGSILGDFKKTNDCSRFIKSASKPKMINIIICDKISAKTYISPFILVSSSKVASSFST